MTWGDVVCYTWGSGLWMLEVAVVGAVLAIGGIIWAIWPTFKR